MDWTLFSCLFQKNDHVNVLLTFLLTYVSTLTLIVLSLLGHFGGKRLLNLKTQATGPRNNTNKSTTRLCPISSSFI